jgi:PTH1 family peptidyl-tRNA hydrolase
VSLTPERSYFGLAARANLADGPVWLLEPMTFMNLSGKSVAALARFFKIGPGEILVAHDELDLMPGHVKMKLGGSHAGHNGLKDIQAQLGSADFWRLRLGIGHPGMKAEVVNYVLRKPLAEQREAIDKSIEQAAAALPLMLEGDMERALMKVHAKPPRPKPPKPTPDPAKEPT